MFNDSYKKNNNKETRLIPNINKFKGPLSSIYSIFILITVYIGTEKHNNICTVQYVQTEFHLIKFSQVDPLFY